MEFLCHRDDFFKAVSSVESIIRSKLSFSPHLANIFIEAKTDKIIIKATNAEMSQIVEIDGKIQKTGNVSISHNRLTNVLRQTPGGELFFQLNDQNILTIKPPQNSRRKSFVEILGIPGNDFLSIPAFPTEGTSLMLDKLYFKKMIQKVLFATGSEPTRYAIHSVLLEMGKGIISLVATDTRKMAWFKTELPEIKEQEESILLPQDFLSHLQKLLTTEGPLQMTIHNQRIFLKFEKYEISSSLVNGEFPKYEMFVPQSSNFSFTASTSELIRAIEFSASVFTESPIPRSVWNLKDGELNLLSQEKDYNQASETISVVYQGQKFSVGFNVKMILEILKQIETEKVDFYFNGEISPFVVKENNRNESTYVIMPIKLSH